MSVNLSKTPAEIMAEANEELRQFCEELKEMNRTEREERDRILEKRSKKRIRQQLQALQNKRT